MAIKFVALLLVLFLCHTLPDLVRLRDFSWWRKWLEQLGRPPSAAGALALGVVAPVLVCALVQWGLRLPWFGLLEFLFSAAVLYYAWGPRDLERDVEAIDKASDTAQRTAAAQALKQENDGADVTFDAEHLVLAVFHAGLKRWFGVLFWFAVLGPCGALLYRLAQLLAAETNRGIFRDRSEAQHDRCRKRPRLRGMVIAGAHAHAGFLEDFAAHCVFERFARLDEAGQRRIAAFRPLRTAAEQAAALMADDDDDCRIGARKMCDATL